MPDSHVSSVAQFREQARRRLPRMVFDFVDGGGGSEDTIRGNRAALDAKRLICSGPADVSKRGQAVTLFGRVFSAPMIIGPTGLIGASRPKGDALLAAAASRENIPFVMSTAATCTMEEVKAAGDGAKWMQLYLFQTRSISERLLADADRNGFEVLEITVDNPVAGLRRRDVRNGFSVPLKWTPSKLLSLAAHPGWTWSQVRAGGPEMLLLSNMFGKKEAATVAQLFHDELDPSVNWDDIARVRDKWHRPLVVKGLLDPAQVRKALSVGVDGVVVSNHGGRQLDGAVATIDVLPEFVSEARGRLTILIDSGFRSGYDIARALALGASAVQVGRATLYALAAGGEDGVVHCLQILKEELDVAQAMMGVRSVAELRPHMIYRAGESLPAMSGAASAAAAAAS